jgi:phosphopantothenoylcysteine decarboxylase/phosphopantothenate--cysteine ligase
LTQAGADVDVVLTRSAEEFVGAVTFEALTGRAVHTALVQAGHALDHIRLARSAEVVVVAPATADFIARAASGRADDLMTACLLATTAPVLIVPAMNDRMWAHAQTAANVAHIRHIGYHVLDPEIGALAHGEGAGPGRMPEPETILAHVGRLLEPPGALVQRRVVVSAGPTREAMDPVRFLSNRSSGKMGVAIAAAAWRRGADTVLVAGPLSTPPPTGAQLVAVETASEMRDAIARELGAADVLIMAAAPADFRPEQIATSKIRKQDMPPDVELAPTPDILSETRADRRRGMLTVGFALETDDAIASAKEKLAAKALDLIVVNRAGESDAGFEVDTNRVTLVYRDGRLEEIPLMTKAAVADEILDRVEGMLRGR